MIPKTKFRSRVKRTKKSPGEMNKTEQSYANILKIRMLAGEILHYDYEPVSLRLAANTFFIPDFRVIMADHTIEFHEVKAATANGGFRCEDDARVKFKVAAESHWMYGFRMVGMRKGNVVKGRID